MFTLKSKILSKALQAKAKIGQWMKSESGETNIIAIILILAIVIALAIIFKDQLGGLFNKIWSSLFSNVDQVI